MEAPFAKDGVAAGVLTTDAERSALRAMFAGVAAERGWTPGDDLGGDPNGSVLIGAWVDRALAGGVELRLPNWRRSVPLFSTWPELAGLQNAAELVLLALVPERRGTPGLLWTLCAETWRHCRRSGVADLLAAVPPRNLRIYRRLGWRPEPVGPEREHWGEPCLPCRIGVAEVATEFGRLAARSPAHALAVGIAFRD